MLKNLTFVCVFLFLSVNPYLVSAETYSSAQYVALEYDEKVIEPLASSAVLLRFGARGDGRFSDFSFETRLATKLDSEENDIAGINAVVEIKSLLGFYAVHHFDAGFTGLYLTYGYTSLHLDRDLSDPVTGATTSIPLTDATFSYGLGAVVDLYDNMSLTAEFMRYNENSLYTLDAISAGLAIGF